MRSQLGGEVDGSRSIRPPDDSNGRGFLNPKTQQQCPEEGNVNPKLSSRSQEERLGVCDQGAEVRKRPDSQKDEGRDDLPFEAVVVKDIDQFTFSLEDSHKGRDGQIYDENSEANGDQ